MSSTEARPSVAEMRERLFAHRLKHGPISTRMVEVELSCMLQKRYYVSADVLLAQLDLEIKQCREFLRDVKLLKEHPEFYNELNQEWILDIKSNQRPGRTP